MKRFSIFILILLLTGIFNLPSNAYAPQYSSEKTNQKLRWKTNVIQIAFSNSLLKPNINIKPESDVIGALRRSLETWENAADVTFETIWTDKQTVSATENAGDKVSLITIAPTAENLLMFSKDAEQVSARTRVFFNSKGYINEADIVLNPYQQFSTDGSVGTFDLESTLTHEIGHLLGLEHSSVFGATMHENSGKNGVFNLPSYDARTLAATDVSAIRAIYGNKETENCCGAASGKLTLPNGKAARNFQVWLEDENGKVVGHSVTNADGSYLIEGIEAGRYTVLTQEIISSKQTLASESLGEVEIKKANETVENKKLTASPKTFDLQYVGFNGQLSELAVPVNAGKTYFVYLGAKKLDLKNLKIGFNSPFLKINQSTITEQDYGENLSVVSFEVRVDAKTPPGEYSIFAENDKKNKEFIVGSLVIEKFSNPWSSFVLTDE